MQITVLRKELEQILDLATNVVSKKSINPILQNILLTAKHGELEIAATDLEVSILVSLGAEVHQEGEITVLNSLLREIIKSARSETIEIVSESDGNVTVRAVGTSYEANIHSISPGEYPVINKEELENAPSFFIKGFLLQEMLNKNIPFSAKDDVRYTFNSVYFEKDNLDFKTVSSDTKRLALAKTFVDSSTTDFSLLIPIKTAKILKDMLGENELELRIMNKKAGFIYDNITLISNQIEGKFPDYKNVIPKETNFNIPINKKDFADTIKSLAPFLTGDVQKVLLSFEDGVLHTTTDETELGKGQNQMDIEYSGETIEMAFNYKFLQDIIAVVEEDEIVIKIWQADKPAIFAGKDNDNTLFVTVPMKR